VHSTSSIDSLAPFLRQTHSRYPQQGLMMTEFGAEADVSGPADEKQTYAFQTSYLERTLGIVGSLPFMNGAIYWTLREFAVKPHWDGGAHRHDVPHTSIHHKGLISYGGVPKPAFAVAARLFANTPFYRSPAPIAPFAVPPAAGPPSPGPGAPVVALLALLALAATLIAIRTRPHRRITRRRERPLPRVDTRGTRTQPW
jgi:beta-glucuronidase